MHWVPTRNVCIDEGMCPWKGRARGVRVFIVGKPHPNGVKIYIMVDRTGYVYDFWFYQGKQPATKDIIIEFAEALPGTMC